MQLTKQRRGSSWRFDFIAVLEALYQETSDLHAWHAGVLDAAQSALAQQSYCDFFWLREAAEGRRTLEMADARGVLPNAGKALASALSLFETGDEHAYKRFFYPRRRVVEVTTVLADVRDHAVRAAVRQFFANSGMRDVLGLVVHPVPGVAGVLALDWTHDGPCAGAMRTSFQRVQLHLESALRLRLNETLSAKAILRPDGRVEHLDVEAETPIDTDALSGRVGRIERIRSARERERQTANLALWQALVDGRFSLVEVRDKDGKRHYHAFENAPSVRRFLALSTLESQVVEQAAHGRTGKEIAYGLGIHRPDVSRAIASAVTKLGFRSRTDLVRASRALRQLPLRDPPDTLTCAEREVLELVQLGHSNAAIARLRGRSVSTIANQVAAILAKTSTHGRRGLTCLNASMRERWRS
jgi:DNA-binding NarL/FixJ family response regulator